jgi:hypothetical protein
MKKKMDVIDNSEGTKGKVSKDPNSPSLEYADPINQKDPKTIEVGCEGVEWV